MRIAVSSFRERMTMMKAKLHSYSIVLILLALAAATARIKSVSCGFDEFEAKIIANYASASYCDIGNLKDWTCSRCNDGCQPGCMFQADHKGVRSHRKATKWPQW